MILLTAVQFEIYHQQWPDLTEKKKLEPVSQSQRSNEPNEHVTSARLTLFKFSFEVEISWFNKSEISG